MMYLIVLYFVAENMMTIRCSGLTQSRIINTVDFCLFDGVIVILNTVLNTFSIEY